MRLCLILQYQLRRCWETQRILFIKLRTLTVPHQQEFMISIFT